MFLLFRALYLIKDKNAVNGGDRQGDSQFLAGVVVILLNKLQLLVKHNNSIDNNNKQGWKCNALKKPKKCLKS